MLRIGSFLSLPIANVPFWFALLNIRSLIHTCVAFEFSMFRVENSINSNNNTFEFLTWDLPCNLKIHRTHI